MTFGPVIKTSNFLDSIYITSETRAAEKQALSDVLTWEHNIYKDMCEASGLFASQQGQHGQSILLTIAGIPAKGKYSGIVFVRMVNVDKEIVSFLLNLFEVLVWKALQIAIERKLCCSTSTVQCSPARYSARRSCAFSQASLCWPRSAV